MTENNNSGPEVVPEEDIAAAAGTVSDEGNPSVILFRSRLDELLREHEEHDAELTRLSNERAAVAREVHVLTHVWYRAIIELSMKQEQARVRENELFVKVRKACFMWSPRRS